MTFCACERANKPTIKTSYDLDPDTNILTITIKDGADVLIDTITIDTLIKEYDIDVNDINLIKLDVEGGEKIIIPHIKEFLNIHKPTFYISLHYCYLRDEEVVEIVNTLFEIYDKCFIVSNDGIFKQVNKKEVLSSKSENLVFEK